MISSNTRNKSLIFINNYSLREEEPPIFDLTCFKSCTFRIITISSAVSYAGVNMPNLILTVIIFYYRPDVSSVLLACYFGPQN